MSDWFYCFSRVARSLLINLRKLKGTIVNYRKALYWIVLIVIAAIAVFGYKIAENENRHTRFVNEAKSCLGLCQN